MHPANRTALNILVVDDDVAVARALGRLLRSCGHAVRTSHSAREGLEVASPMKPASTPGWKSPITAGKLEIVLAMASERQRAQAGRTGTVK